MIDDKIQEIKEFTEKLNALGDKISKDIKQTEESIRGCGISASIDFDDSNYLKYGRYKSKWVFYIENKENRRQTRSDELPREGRLRVHRLLPKILDKIVENQKYILRGE